MNSARFFHTATRLANGKVLVAGGINADNSGGNPALASAELYDPSTGTWSLTSSLNHARTNYTATKLTSGQVLVAGGVPSGGGGVTGPPMATAELYG
jgi:N-acetylneuraminic acid mutarotase